MALERVVHPRAETEWTYNNVRMGPHQESAGAGSYRLPRTRVVPHLWRSHLCFHPHAHLLTYPSVSWQEAHGTANQMIEEFLKRPCTVMWVGLEEPTCKVTPTPWPDGPKEGTITSTRWELPPWNRAPERSCACREANWATPDRGRGGRGCKIQKKTQTVVKISWTT